ncbi:MAG: PAS domain-containing sensor histidine kinase [Bacteroidia bacterium]|nr:PAS domain-containing sensor histidine kinase [Bacteroidia bacterium]
MGTKFNTESFQKADDFADLLQLGKSAIQQIADTDHQSDRLLSSLFPDRIFAESKQVSFKDPYQIIVDNLPHMVFLKNIDSVYTTCNKQFADFLDTSQSDIIGKTDIDLFPETLALLFQYEDKHTLDQGIPCQFVQDYRKDDQKRFFQITKIPIQGTSGKNLGILGIIIEIADIILFKKIVEDGQSPKDLIGENDHDVFYKIDQCGVGSYISKNIIRLTGYSQEEQLKMSHAEQLERESVKVYNELMSFYSDVLKGPISAEDRPKYHRRVDLELKKKDGTSVWVESANYLYFSSTGEIKGIVGMYRNINDRKMLEFKLQETHEKLKLLSKAQGQIISTISHEFKTPISVLQSNLQLLSKRRNNLDDNILDEIFDLSLEAIKVLNGTLNNISFLAKNQKGAFNLVTQEIDLNQFIKKLIREIVCIPEYANRIICSVKLNKTHFQLDPTMMEHILMNLLINGLNFSSPRKKVRLGVEERPDHLFFSIKDTGIGIPEEDMDRIFESFYRASNVKGIKGSGLGLAIVKECVTLQGGNIRIFSIPDEGTEVEFTIPFGNG